MQIEAARCLGFEGRMRLTFELSADLHANIVAGIRCRHPDYTDEQLRQATIRVKFGEALFREIYPDSDVQP